MADSREGAIRIDVQPSSPSSFGEWSFVCRVKVFWTNRKEFYSSLSLSPSLSLSLSLSLPPSLPPSLSLICFLVVYAVAEVLKGELSLEVNSSKSSTSLTTPEGYYY